MRQFKVQHFNHRPQATERFIIQHFKILTDKTSMYLAVLLYCVMYCVIFQQVFFIIHRQQLTTANQSWDYTM